MPYKAVSPLINPKAVPSPAPAFVETTNMGVAILLSTYNGAQFLREQLNSLLSQTHQHWVLHWRDEGSKDETVHIMRDFALHAGRGRCVESPSSGHHLGVLASYLTLLRETLGAMAIAFADQDDVWLPGKLQQALTHIAAAGSAPTLYCSRQYLVDEHLQNPKPSTLYKQVPPFPGCLAYNLANGNTIMLNTAAAALVAAVQEPDGSIHDWWSYIVIRACGGNVIFDPTPQLLYRIHQSNVVGRIRRSFYRRAKAALQRGSSIYMTIMYRHINALRRSSLPLTPQARQSLDILHKGLLGTPQQRLTAMLCPHFCRQTMIETLLLRFWFLSARRLLNDNAPIAMTSGLAKAQSSQLEETTDKP